MKKEKQERRSEGSPKPIFKQGEESFLAAAQWDSDSKGKLTNRFKLKNPGDSAIVFLLDDAVIHYQEHRSEFQEKPWYRRACIVEVEHCPDCDRDRRARPVWLVGTIINFTGFKNDNGERVKYFKQLFLLDTRAAREELQSVRKQLMKEQERENPLAMLKLKITRGRTKQSPSTGERFEPKGYWTRKQLREHLQSKGVERDDWKDFFTPLDYEQLLAPGTEEDYRRAIGLSEVSNRPGQRPDYDDPDINDDFD